MAKGEAAALASLALAPPAPAISRISRGKSGYDAVLGWSQPEGAADVAGYVVMMRSTTAPEWEKAVQAGNVTEYTLPDVSVDDVVFGVKAVGKDGDESLVAPWIMVAHPNEKIEARQEPLR